MPSNHVNRVLRESEAVTKRMHDSKKEIEALRIEYEKLLARNTQAATLNITDTDKEIEIQNKREEIVVGDGLAKAVQRGAVKRRPLDKVAASDSARTNLEQISPPKVRHYKVEDAREYIRKQKERRMQQQKQFKETDNALELKKQKLKELHQKSLQIVAKNRQRSKSRENKQEEVLPTTVSHLEPAPASATGALPVVTKPLIQSILKPTMKVLKPHSISSSNITYRDAAALISDTKPTQIEENTGVKYVKSSAKSDDAKIKAATLIQACFRGHIQRKLYKDAIKRRLTSRDSTQISKKAAKQQENQEIINNSINNMVNTLNAQNADVESRKVQKKIPDWLQIEPSCHPFNFINSVKRKLNVALSTPVKTSDVGIQSSFSEKFPYPIDTTPQRYKDMKEKIELSLSSKKSDKEINDKIERSLAAIRNIQREQCLQLLSEGEAGFKSSKQTLNGYNQEFLDLDVKRLDNMRLQSDHSDSDTSKNIPDISLESKYKRKVSSSASSRNSTGTTTCDSASSLLKYPKEPPPKPKRLARHDLHSANKSDLRSVSEVVCMDSQKDANHAHKYLDEYKLTIDADKLKNIKLQRRIKSAPCLENTMMHYEVYKQSKDDHVNPDSSTTSIDTLSDGSQVKRSKSQSTSHPSTLISFKTEEKSNRSHHSQETSHKSRTSHSLIKTEAYDSSKSKPKTNSLHCNNSVTRRDSTISGNITNYTKSFESYKTNPYPSNISEKVVQLEADITADIPEELLSFRQYMKDLDETQRIMHTPFQPKGVRRGADAERRLQDVISKVNMLDQSQQVAKTAHKDAKERSIGSQETANEFNNVDVKCDKSETVDPMKLSEVTEEREKNQDSVNIVPLQEGKLIAPDVNLIVMKCSEDKNEKIHSGKASTETIAAGPQQIHVKFEAELHLLNDFNESLKQIMNIEKSMLDLQTKYNLPPRETKDTQTSVITTKSSNIAVGTTNTSNTSGNASIIQQSINFSRGSDIVEENIDDGDKLIVLHRNNNILDSSRSNSNSTLNLNISDLMQSAQNVLSVKTNTMNASDMDVTMAKDKDGAETKLNSAGISVDMFDQLIRDEDARIDNLKTVLKIKEKALLDRTKGELTWLEIQKKHLLETGKLHEASLLKKKQRGIILRLQEEKNEMQKLREAQKAASKERKTKLKEQCALIKAQLRTPNTVTRIRRTSERRSSGPVKVYQSEYYQSETSVSRKSSLAESVVYAAHSASIVSHRADDGASAATGAIAATASCTELAKRSLQMREAALQKRRKEAEDLLRWHQKLLREERKIAELEMAASNVINQVPAADGDKYTYKTAIAQPSVWKEPTVATVAKIKPKTIEVLQDVSISSKYSTDFESDKDGALEKTSQVSDSINEIMHNINNITDEITELYKLSSMQKVANKTDSNSKAGGDNLLMDISVSQLESKSHGFKASIISKPTSVPEVSVRVEEKEPSLVITEVPTQATIAETNSASKDSFIRLKSNELSLNEVQLPERDETEDDVSSIKSEVRSELQKPTNDSLLHSHLESQHDDESEGCDTLKEQIDSRKQLISEHEDGQPEGISTDSAIMREAKSEADDFVPSEKASLINFVVQPEVLEETKLFTNKSVDIDEILPIQFGQITYKEIVPAREDSVPSDEILPSSKDITEISIENESALNVFSDFKEFNEVEDVSLLPSSIVDASRKEHAEPSVLSEILPTVEDINEDLSAKVESNHSALGENGHSSIGSEIHSEPSQLFSLQNNNVIQSEYGNSLESSEIQIDDVINEDTEEEINDLESKSNFSDSKSSKTPANEEQTDVEEILPIIGVIIEEKKCETISIEQDISEESIKSQPLNKEQEVEDEDGSSSVKESLHEVENSITEVELRTLEDEELMAKRSAVKKRVSEILADANLNTSIEEKSPRLPDIYVTTYDVISPENSPELGSPVDSPKAKPKDIYGIGNEAQELLKKQLAIEQEIKQIERQQKEQLPYIFVREIPNKPPPPYTPPVQQPSSIVPATPAQVEELVPHFADIFHRGFVDKTLEYVTFPDSQLGQLGAVDKICAEFLFDIAKDCAISHFKHFVEPDEKAPLWMRLNKPKSFKRPHTRNSLEIMLKKKLKQLFAFQKSDTKESMIIKWSRKKRDHVDELLVVESQSEEAEWTNYDQDELIVREEVTTGLLNMLLDETAMCLKEIFAKRQAAASHC